MGAIATSLKVYNLVIDCKVILSDKEIDKETKKETNKYFEPTMSTIEKYFGSIGDEKVIESLRSDAGTLDMTKLREEVANREDSSYWVVMKQLSYEEISAYQEFMESREKEDKKISQYVKGIWFEDDYKRKYPFDDLACSVVGFLNNDGASAMGIESYYDEYLTGINGRQYGYVNADSNMEAVIKDPMNGNTVVSTLDMNVQRIVQNKIQEYKKKYKPKRLAVVIANPNTGEILAMADDTPFNLNDPRNLSNYFSESKINSMSDSEMQTELNAIWRNFCISDAYEPGSTAKPFTVATAYEEGMIDENTTYVCDGHQAVPGYIISCHKTDGHGTITTKQSIAYSCNDAMMQIGAKMGAKIFTQYQTRFGLGLKTGIDLPGETRGLVYGEDMDVASLATNSFGQNFTVNMVQMVAGFSSLVNGGYYYEPHVVKEVQTEDGSLIENYSKSIVRQTVTNHTSAYIRECLRAVVTDGTGKGAAIAGYTVGGKTGTAEKHGKNGVIKNQYIVSFLGCVPVENPKVVCYTLMDSPKDDPDSTAYNTEFWNAVMTEVLPYLHIEKTEDAGKDKDIQGTTQDDIAGDYVNGISHAGNIPEGQTQNGENPTTENGGEPVTTQNGGENTISNNPGE